MDFLINYFLLKMKSFGIAYTCNKVKIDDIYCYKLVIIDETLNDILKDLWNADKQILITEENYGKLLVDIDIKLGMTKY